MFGLGHKKLTYKCHCCGKIYRGSPSFAYEKPCYYFDVPEDERAERIKIDSDLCHIRPSGTEDSGQDIFAIRCTLDIPIHKVAEPFSWRVWVTQSEENFYRYVETYDADQSGIVTFAWLTVVMPYYGRIPPPDPLENLACDMHWGGKGQRPKIVLHETDHPLYHDQCNGISWEKAVEIALYRANHS